MGVGRGGKPLRSRTTDPAPRWVTCVPSRAHPELVPEFAARLAVALELPFAACLSKIRDNDEQKEMHNSFQQAANLDGAFAVDAGSMLDDPCVLVDDMTGSGWTFTVTAALLRRAGCAAVFPLALALNSPRMD